MAKKSEEASLLTKQKVGAYKRRNPDTPITTIAEMFGVTRAQAAYYIKQYDEGKLTKSKPRVRKRKVEELKDVQTDDLFERQVRVILESLESDDKLDPETRASILEKTARMSLGTHLRRADAEIIIRIIRRFIPDASEMECIKIYKEELAKWSAEKR